MGNKYPEYSQEEIFELFARCLIYKNDITFDENDFLMLKNIMNNTYILKG